MLNRVYEFENNLAELERLLGVLEATCNEAGATPKQTQQLQVAMEELFVNIVHYAFPDQNSHTIRLRADANETELKLRLEDDGQPFNPAEAPAPDLDVPLEERTIGGLGVFLARKFADKFEYIRENDHNLVTVTKYLSSQQK